MDNTYSQIYELLQQRADYQARLNLLPYAGRRKRKNKLPANRHGRAFRARISNI